MMQQPNTPPTTPPTMAPTGRSSPGGGGGGAEGGGGLGAGMTVYTVVSTTVGMAMTATPVKALASSMDPEVPAISSAAAADATDSSADVTRTTIKYSEVWSLRRVPTGVPEEVTKMSQLPAP